MSPEKPHRIRVKVVDGKPRVRNKVKGRLVPHVDVFDNSVDGVEARLCARTRDGQLRKVYGPLPAWVSGAVEHLPRHPAFADLLEVD